MADVPNLVRKRGIIKRKLTNFISFLKNYNTIIDAGARATNSKIKELQIRLDQFQGLSNEFEEVQLQIELSCTEQELEEQFDQRDKFSNSFVENLSIAKTFMDKLEAPNNSAIQGKDNRIDDDNHSQCSVQNETNILKHIKLPTISLPIFKGNYNGWLEFKDTFESLIHTNSSINAIQKYHYLRASLEGDARKVILSQEFSGNNYTIAWDLLCARYNNSRLLVHNHIKAMFDIENMNKETASELRYIIDKVSQHLRALETLNQPTQYWDTLIIFIISIKLDKSTARDWEGFKVTCDFPNLKDFINFLSARADLLETLEINHGKTAYQSQEHQGKRQSAHRVSLTTTNRKCNFCKEEHTIYNCSKFLRLSIPERLEKVKQLKLCSNCLLTGHEVTTCRLRHCIKCHLKHNFLLHQEPIVQNDQGASITPTENPVVLSTYKTDKTVLLSTIVLAIYDSCGNKHEARALLDSGSQSNFITSKLSKLLNLKQSAVDISIVGINKITSTINSKCKVFIKSLNSNFSTTIGCYVLTKITDPLPASLLDITNWNIPKDICLADPNFNKPAEIDLLIGAGLFWQILSDQVIKLKRDLPILRSTSFGWIVSGAFNEPITKQTFCHISKTVNLEEQVRAFWEIEEVTSIKPSLSRDDQDCEDNFCKTVTRNDQGRFVVCIPFKHPPSLLGSSLNTAIKRLMLLERKFEKNPDFKQSYSKFMTEYMELGHMSLQDSNEHSKISYFLPHHGVLNENSVTTKLRVVFDGSSPSDSGWALNDLQYVGPTVLNDIVDILLRFRQHRFVVMSDVEKMYRQILVSPNDRNLQKIVWRDNPNSEVQVYNLNTITYGTTSAPFLAIRCLKQLAYDNQSKFPISSTIIERDFYVDDLITGFNSEDEAIKISKEISEILKGAQLPLRKWHSNSKFILNALQDHNDLISILSLGDNQTLKTLGVCWNSNLDILTYRISPMPTTVVSKRSILSESAKIFDPLGLVGPCVILVKIILQRLWLLKSDWDDPVPDDIAYKWLFLRNNLLLLNKFSIIRHVICNQSSRIELHGFCDASQDAYASCIYMRSVDTENNVHINLLCAKTKVAPLKVLTIPRLELCSALLLVRLAKKVSEALTISFTSFFWSDSQIVLAWLKTDPKCLQNFVGNRISEIQSLSCVDNWHHVRSKENPADLGSRGVMPDILLTSKLWWNGPKWLSNLDSQWSNETVLDSSISIPELKRSCKVFVTTTQESFPFERFSKFERLQRAVAYCFRFISNARKSPQNRYLGILTVDELHNSLKKLIQFAQVNDFSQEIKILNSKKELHIKSNLSGLSPFMDDDHLLRVGGRLKNADLPFNTKHPWLLDGKHHLTKLIFEKEHLALLHAGPQLLLSQVRQTYWPTSGMKIAKQVVGNCVKCFRFRPKFNNPIMANLPQGRVTIANPFDTTGIDYAGPFMLKNQKGRGAKVSKAYVCVFVCFVSKALHLELVTDLTTNSFIACLRRFISRRGKPKHIYSDNGTNFVGAHNELKILHKFFENSGNAIINDCAREKITWHFIPPNSPHFGGLWEAGVKSVKQHLLKVIFDTKLTYEEFITVLAQIEAILNNRPLYPFSSDPNDLQPLTPFHFLIGRPFSDLQDPTLTDLPLNRLSRFQLLQQIKQSFWSRWSRDYLTQLQKKTKWSQSVTVPKVDTMVIIKNDNQQPCHWILGRIINVHPGDDGVIRVVSVKTSNGILKRAVTKVCALPEV